MKWARMALYRDKILNIELTTATQIESFDLGPIKAKVIFEIRIPVWLCFLLRPRTWSIWIKNRI